MAVPNSTKKFLLDPFAAQPVKAMFLSSTHVTDVDAQVFISDVDANQVTGTNYPAGGFTMVNVAIVQDNATDQVRLDFDDQVVNNLTVTFRSVTFYNDSADRLTSRIINTITYPEDQVYTDDNMTIQVPAAGLLYI